MPRTGRIFRIPQVVTRQGQSERHTSCRSFAEPKQSFLAIWKSEVQPAGSRAEFPDFRSSYLRRRTHAPPATSTERDESLLATIRHCAAARTSNNVPSRNILALHVLLQTTDLPRDRLHAVVHCLRADHRAGNNRRCRPISILNPCAHENRANETTALPVQPPGGSQHPD